MPSAVRVNLSVEHDMVTRAPAAVQNLVVGLSGRRRSRFQREDAKDEDVQGIVLLRDGIGGRDRRRQVS